METTRNETIPFVEEKSTTRYGLTFFSPTVDFLLAGGFSLIFFIACHLFIDPEMKIYKISWIAFYAAYLINDPHFIISYILLYRDNRAQLLKNPRMIIAGVVVPLMLLLSLVAILIFQDQAALSYIIMAMFVLVVWHYAKQVFGIFMVTAHKKKYSVNKPMRIALRVLVFGVASINLLGWNQAPKKYFFHHHFFL